MRELSASMLFQTRIYREKHAHVVRSTLRATFLGAASGRFCKFSDLNTENEIFVMFFRVYEKSWEYAVQSVKESDSLLH